MLRSKTIPLILGICMVYKTFADSTQTTQEQITGIDNQTNAIQSTSAASGSSGRYNKDQRIKLGIGISSVTVAVIGIIVTIIIAYRCANRGRNSMDNERPSASRAVQPTDGTDVTTPLTVNDSAGSAQHGARGGAGVSVPGEAQEPTDSSHHQDCKDRSHNSMDNPRGPETEGASGGASVLQEEIVQSRPQSETPINITGDRNILVVGDHNAVNFAANPNEISG